MTPTLVLYTTPGCHLCRHAKDLVDAYAAYDGSLRVKEQDVLETVPPEDESAQRIPLLEAPGGARLYWPFDGADLHRWLHGM